MPLIKTADTPRNQLVAAYNLMTKAHKGMLKAEAPRAAIDIGFDLKELLDTWSKRDSAYVSRAHRQEIGQDFKTLHRLLHQTGDYAEIHGLLTQTESIIETVSVQMVQRAPVAA